MAELNGQETKRLWEELSRLDVKLDKIVGSITDRQERAYARQLPTLLSAAAVLLSIGTLVATNLSGDISENSTDFKAHRKSGEAHGLDAVRDDVATLKQWREKTDDRMADVAHRASVANAASVSLKQDADKQEDRINSIWYKLTLIEGAKERP